MLIEKIKSDALEARKARKTEVATLLTTLYSEASMIGKNSGNRQSIDKEVLQVIEKFVKNANEVKDILLESGKDASNVIFEIETLRAYLPKQMSRDELQEVIKYIIKRLEESGKQIGNVMSNLKANYGGSYDGKMASEIVKKELANDI